MSKKRLARTVIEGGRTGIYKEVVRRQKKTERSEFRTYCHLAAVDPESAEENIPDVAPLDSWSIDNPFKDKLSPMYNWLFAQVGKPWAEVYSAIRNNFDTRTTAGRHIIFDHLLRDINIYNDINLDYRDFAIDDDGILVLTERGKQRYFQTRKRYNHKYDERNEATFNRLADGRFVIDYGPSQFWRCPITLRQTERLTQEEALAWNKLTGSQRKRFTERPDPSEHSFGGWLAFHEPFPKGVKTAKKP